jgi:hypothetical protein
LSAHLSVLIAKINDNMVGRPILVLIMTWIQARYI